MVQKLIIIHTLFLFSSSSIAGFFINPSFSYRKKSETDTSAVETIDTVQYIDAYFGWNHIKGLLLGYSYNKTSVDREESNLTYQSSKSITASGPVIGWISPKPNGAFFTFAWYNSAELEETNYTSTEYEGNGVAVNIGYKVIIKRVGYGFGILSKSFKFDKQKLASGEIELTNPIKYNDIAPAVHLWILF
jgi:hypothetical protein